MNPLAQLWHALVIGPLALVRLRWRALLWLLAYLALCGGLLALVGHLVVKHQHDLLGAAARYVFPAEWEATAERLVERFLRAQLREVLVNATVGGTLVLLSVLLFPLKEQVSKTFERESRLTGEPIRELPLWLQAVEETQLFLLFLTAQMTIFWIGYPPDPTRRKVALVLSYATLFASFGVDFLAPLLQRHGLKYTTIYKVLLKHPVALFAFGAAFTLPTVAAGRVAAAHPEWTFQRAVTVLFAVNTGCIAWACIAGTHVAARLLPAALATRRPSWVVRGLGFLGAAALLAANVWMFGTVGLSLQRKSQILKCRYTVVPGTLGLDLPELSALARGEPLKLGVRLDVEIENPTRFDVAIEKNRLEVRHGDAVVALAGLTPMRVAAGAKVRQHVELPIRVSGAALRRGRALLEWRRYAVTLFLEVSEGFDFPVYLVKATAGGG